MVLVSYCLQLIQLALALLADPTNGQQNGDFVLSHFLVFFSSALGALAVMMATLPIGTSPGVAQAQQALHRTFTVILVVAVHTMATEWMEEDMVLVCMPGLIAALVWFTVNFDHGRCTVSVDKVTARKSSGIVLAAAAALLAIAYLTSKFAYEYEVLANCWYTRILCSCTLSGVLSYFSVWMIHQWPGSTGSAKALIQLLEFSAQICFGILAMILIQPTSSSGPVQSFTADLRRQWVLPEALNILDLEVAIYSVLLCIFFACVSILYGSVGNDGCSGSSTIKLVVMVGCTMVLSSLYTQFLKYKLTVQPQD